MDELKFEWNADKAAKNLRKHGVAFEEAKTVFLDDAARLISDPDHSGDEERFILLGYSNKPRMLLVCHCYRGEADTIRIISARKAEKHEKRQYEGFKL